MDINTMKSVYNTNLYELYNSLIWHVSQLSGCGIDYVPGTPIIRDHSTLLEWYLSNVCNILDGTSPIVIADGSNSSDAEYDYAVDNLSIMSEKTLFGILITIMVARYHIDDDGGLLEPEMVYHHFLLN